MDNFDLERNGQIDFYNTFLPRVNPNFSIKDIISNNNDGVLNGNLLEFKLNITDLNSVLFQCIKYLSAMRIKGKPIPANILIVDINVAIVRHYLSEWYIKEIECLYSGGASKDNSGFIGNSPKSTLSYNKSENEVEKIIQLLKENKFTKINIDENCIVEWAEHYYRKTPNARKDDFIGEDSGKHKTIGEIREPKVFSEYIIPYKGITNIKFKYLMDMLNDFLQKKNLGAFYTPSLYA